MTIQKAILPGTFFALVLSGCFQDESVSGNNDQNPPMGGFERNTSDPTNPGYSPIRPGEILVKPGSAQPSESTSAEKAPAAKAAAGGWIGILSGYGANVTFLMDAQNGTTSTKLMRYTGIAPFPWTTNNVNQETGAATYGLTGVSAPSHSSGTGRDVKLQFQATWKSSLPRLAEDYAVLRLNSMQSI